MDNVWETEKLDDAVAEAFKLTVIEAKAVANWAAELSAIEAQEAVEVADAFKSKLAEAEEAILKEKNVKEHNPELVDLAEITRSLLELIDNYTHR